jgi:hypothetical protein
MSQGEAIAVSQGAIVVSQGAVMKYLKVTGD